MLACKGIFARPSMAQRARKVRGRSEQATQPASAGFCAYYTTKQKCVLAQAFLRGRQ